MSKIFLAPSQAALDEQRQASCYSYPQLQAQTQPDSGIVVQLMRLLRFCIRSKEDQLYFAETGGHQLHKLFINNDQHVREQRSHGDMDNLEMLNLWWASCLDCSHAIKEYAADPSLMDSDQFFSLWVLLGPSNMW